MDHLSLPKEFDYIVDIRVIRQPKDIIIGRSGFLLCCNRINTTISRTENSSNRELKQQRKAPLSKTAVLPFCFYEIIRLQ